MKKYLHLLGCELKNVARDPFQLYLCAFPVVLLILAVYVFPPLFRTIDPANEEAARFATLLLIVVMLTVGNFLTGALGTFLLLEQKDERTISTIAVTPVGMSGYLKFKMIYIYALSVISTAAVLAGMKYLAQDEYVVGGVRLFGRIGMGQIASYALVSGLFAPALALLQGALARNKVEGFALVKGTGITAMVPILMLLEPFRDGLQYALGIFPNFWAVKGLMLELFPVASPANLSYPAYLLAGAVYSCAVFALSYRLFMRRVQV